MGKSKIEEPVDGTAWMLDNDVANFVLLHQKEVLYMCMVSVTHCWSTTQRYLFNCHAGELS